MIRKSIAFLLLTPVCLTAFAQSFVGYGYDNYSGVNGVLLNPATMADSRYKVNVNLFAISALAGNNAYEIDRSRLFGFHFSNMPEKHGYYKSTNTDYKYFYNNLDILGPSATISLTKKDALGLITRLRSMSNIYNLGDSLFRLIGDGSASYYNVNMMNRSLQMKSNAFAEAGVSYSRVIFKGQRDEMKLGITGKYLIGLGYASLTSGPIAIDVDPNNNIVNLQADVTAQYSGNLDNAGNGMNISRIMGKQSGHGFGLDIGFVYEKMSEDPSTAKLRLGISVTDIGSIKYTNSANSQEYTVSASGASAQQFGIQNGETLSAYFTRLKTAGLVTTKAAAPMATVNLPTALHLNFDYEIYKRLFINGDILFNMLATTSPTSPNYVTTATVTPRLEKKWVSIYSPVSYNVNGQLTWGAGVRFGPVFVGSGSVLSSLLKQRIQTADAHIGLTIPIFQHGKTPEDKKHKADTVYRSATANNDRDGDGVIDSKDNCPDSAGPVALIGCPDRDGDGVPDIKDKCPDVKGSANFQGCPAPDSDGDSVNDDEDKCPLVKGDKANFGCPTIRPELVQRVKNAADRIYFVRAKANIEPVSFAELERVADVLKSDSTLRLRIEGFTDDEGPDAREMRLSARRAQAVEKYLVVLGIPPSRMETIGYGKKRPLAPNDSPEGMARNRRVEMVLMNYPGEKKEADKSKPEGGAAEASN